MGVNPNVGALDAVDDLDMKLQFGNYNYVVEADIKGFFDNIGKEMLLEMQAERIDDKAILWLIKKWLDAGVLDTDGKVLYPEKGSPQGGLCKALHNPPYAK
jgi:retron-type reverse transcriptase